MRYISEYRDPAAAKALAEAILKRASRRWTVMEVCGGQTHAILKYGIDTLIAEKIELVHGPGCPVCVTAVELIDKAVEIARRPEALLCSFGDMLRVPGHTGDLLQARAAGGDVRIVYSPSDAVKLAAAHPHRQVVFFAVGFETTAPAHALAVLEAQNLGLKNFSILCSLVNVVPAMEAVMAAPGTRVRGFLAPGHVTAVIGCRPYVPLTENYKAPVVVTGFEPLDILQGILMLAAQLEDGRAEVEIAYRRTVNPEGNARALEMMARVFCVIDRSWRGLGVLPMGGMGLKPEFAAFDAEKRFGRAAPESPEPTVCIAGRVLQGLAKPPDCPAFGAVCTPEHPLGAPMVSSEGACAAYFHYRKHQSHPSS
jgi:hydrogenase expression/formation protein HypD